MSDITRNLAGAQDLLRKGDTQTQTREGASVSLDPVTGETLYLDGKGNKTLKAAIDEASKSGGAQSGISHTVSDTALVWTKITSTSTFSKSVDLKRVFDHYIASGSSPYASIVLQEVDFLGSDARDFLVSVESTNFDLTTVNVTTSLGSARVIKNKNKLVLRLYLKKADVSNVKADAASLIDAKTVRITLAFPSYTNQDLKVGLPQSIPVNQNLGDQDIFPNYQVVDPDSNLYHFSNKVEAELLPSTNTGFDSIAYKDSAYINNYEANQISYYEQRRSDSKAESKVTVDLKDKHGLYAVSTIVSNKDVNAYMTTDFALDNWFYTVNIAPNLTQLVLVIQSDGSSTGTVSLHLESANTLFNSFTSLEGSIVHNTTSFINVNLRTSKDKKVYLKDNTFVLDKNKITCSSVSDFNVVEEGTKDLGSMLDNKVYKLTGSFSSSSIISVQSSAQLTSTQLGTGTTILVMGVQAYDVDKLSFSLKFSSVSNNIRVVNIDDKNALVYILVNSSEHLNKAVKLEIKTNTKQDIYITDYRYSVWFKPLWDSFIYPNTDRKNNQISNLPTQIFTQTSGKFFVRKEDGSLPTGIDSSKVWSLANQQISLGGTAPTGKNHIELPVGVSSFNLAGGGGGGSHWGTDNGSNGGNTTFDSVIATGGRGGMAENAHGSSRDGQPPITATATNSAIIRYGQGAKGGQGSAESDFNGRSGNEGEYGNLVIFKKKLDAGFTGDFVIGTGGTGGMSTDSTPIKRGQDGEPGSIQVQYKIGSVSTTSQVIHSSVVDTSDLAKKDASNITNTKKWADLVGVSSSHIIVKSGTYQATAGQVIYAHAASNIQINYPTNPTVGDSFVVKYFDWGSQSHTVKVDSISLAQGMESFFEYSDGQWNDSPVQTIKRTTTQWKHLIDGTFDQETSIADGQGLVWDADLHTLPNGNKVGGFVASNLAATVDSSTIQAEAKKLHLKDFKDVTAPESGKAIAWDGSTGKTKNISIPSVPSLDGYAKVYFNSSVFDGQSKPWKKNDILIHYGYTFVINDDNISESPEHYSNAQQLASDYILIGIPRKFRKWESSGKNAKRPFVGEIVTHNDAYWVCIKSGLATDAPSISSSVWKHQDYQFGDVLRLDAGKVYSSSGHKILNTKYGVSNEKADGTGKWYVGSTEIASLGSSSGSGGFTPPSGYSVVVRDNTGRELKAGSTVLTGYGLNDIPRSDTQLNLKFNRSFLTDPSDNTVYDIVVKNGDNFESLEINTSTGVLSTNQVTSKDTIPSLNHKTNTGDSKNYLYDNNGDRVLIPTTSEMDTKFRDYTKTNDLDTKINKLGYIKSASATDLSAYAKLDGKQNALTNTPDWRTKLGVFSKGEVNTEIQKSVIHRDDIVKFTTYDLQETGNITGLHPFSVVNSCYSMIAKGMTYDTDEKIYAVNTEHALGDASKKLTLTFGIFVPDDYTSNIINLKGTSIKGENLDGVAMTDKNSNPVHFRIKQKDAGSFKNVSIQSFGLSGTLPKHNNVTYDTVVMITIQCEQDTLHGKNRLGFELHLMQQISSGTNTTADSLPFFVFSKQGWHVADDTYINPLKYSNKLLVDKANTKLDNITSDGETVIKDKAKELNIQNLNNVTFANLANDQFLGVDSAGNVTNVAKPTSPSGATTLLGLTDVSGTPADGKQYGLKYSSSGGGAYTLDEVQASSGGVSNPDRLMVHLRYTPLAFPSLSSQTWTKGQILKTSSNTYSLLDSFTLSNNASTIIDYKGTSITTKDAHTIKLVPGTYLVSYNVQGASSWTIPAFKATNSNVPSGSKTYYRYVVGTSHGHPQMSTYDITGVFPMGVFPGMDNSARTGSYFLNIKANSDLTFWFFSYSTTVRGYAVIFSITKIG